MGLLQAIFGAKPPMGTPPFAPPHLNTGGANPVPAPGERQHGLAGFIDRAFNPSNALGQFGQALVASGGGPLGNAMAIMMQQRVLAGKDGRDFANWKQQYDYEVAHPKKSTAGPHYWESNDGSLHEIGEDGKPVEVYHDPTPKMNFIPDGMGGGQWVALPGTGTSDAPAPGQPEPAPAAAPPAGGTSEYYPSSRPGGLAPRGMRNNNYLNLTLSPFTKSQPGYSGTDKGGRYATFDTPEHGLLAARSLLESYAKRGFDTPSEIINRWAPSSENGRATGNYRDFVARRLGISPDAVVPSSRYGDMVSAMSDFENGRKGTVGVSPDAEAIRAEAQQAIARGADPAKVRARALAMGVTL